MVNRIIAALALGVVLCACQEVKPSTNTLIIGHGDVKVEETRYIATGESSSSLSGVPVTYVITKLEFTNDTNQLLYPIIQHFTLVDNSGTRYTAVDSGSSAFTGVSNDVSGIKPGDKREFTVGFRAQTSTAGFIQYDY